MQHSDILDDWNHPDRRDFHDYGEEDPRTWGEEPFTRRNCRRYDDDLGDYRIDFQDPGGTSALRRATRRNPRNLPCPNCGEPNRLTPADRAKGYQCDACADRAEGVGPMGGYYR